jgi:hypothetical protein
MILHNQRGASVSWEANGREYKWDGYGACEVPDELVHHLKAQGFPVDTTPVPPREKAERAAAGLTEDAKTAEIERLGKELAGALALAGEAKRAAEAADIRATSARADADAANQDRLALEEQIRTLKSDTGEYEKMIAASSSEVTALKEQLRLELAKHQVQQPAASKKKE